MSEPRSRIPGRGGILTVLLLGLPLVATSWWMTRPAAELPTSGPTLAELDVVCIGRVDGLEPVILLEPVVPGRVVAVAVTEGDVVEAGAVLLRLDDEASRLRVEEAAAAVVAAGIEVAAVKQELALHPLRREAQKAALAAAAERVAAARRLLEEKKTARSFGTVTAAELIAAEAEVKQSEQLEILERTRLRELEATDPALKVRAAEVSESVARLALKLAEKQLRDHTLTAPTAGTVLQVRASVGQSVAPGSPQPPIEFRPAGPLVVRAEIEQEFLGRVRPGLRATIRDDARTDSPTWTGTVSTVGRVVARRRSLLPEPGELNGVRTVECVVTLDGGAESLLVGQRMRVRIHREN